MHSKSGDTLDKKGSGSWNSWALRNLANPQGSKKSYNSQGETNSIVKVKPELRFCMQADEDISFRPGIIIRSPPTTVWSFTHGVDASLRTLSLLRLQIAVNVGLSSCCSSLDIGVSSIWWYTSCYFSLLLFFFKWLYIEIELNNLLLKVEIIYLHVMSNFFYQQILWTWN